MITHRDTWMQVKEMNRWFHLQIIIGIFQNYPPIMQSFCFNLSAVFTPPRCQWLVNMQMNLKVLCFHILYDVFTMCSSHWNCSPGNF